MFPFPLSREMGFDPGVSGRFHLAALVQPHLKTLFVLFYPSCLLLFGLQDHCHRAPVILLTAYLQQNVSIAEACSSVVRCSKTVVGCIKYVMFVLMPPFFNVPGKPGPYCVRVALAVS